MKAFKHFSFYETEHLLTDLVEDESKKVFVKEYVKAMRHVASGLNILQGATVLEYLLPIGSYCKPAECCWKTLQIHHRRLMDWELK